ncbi:DUF2786 domain-containing protein [Streptomyces sp. NPDC050509]|uniref:DUF2786 domain-containing protein n=1 Tax=Streptomyces sp. NPDC050509 TaxID=3365620 RepID=UPI0037989A91
MAEHSTADTRVSVEGFGSARDAWLRARVTELSEVLSDFGPELHALIPGDLGDRRLVSAVVLCRVAADEARVQPVAESVTWLELLVPGAHRHDLAGEVRGLRSALVATEDPALRSWNARAWEEIVLALWRRDRAEAAGQGRADDELVSRWGVRVADTAVLSLAGRARYENGLSLPSLTDHLDDEAAEPLSLLARAVLSRPGTAEAIEDSLAVYEDALQGAGHLAFIAEQQLYVEELEEWCDKHARGATQTTEGFLTELREYSGSYADDVLDPLIRSLPAGERTLFRTATSRDCRDRNEYLTEFLDCVVPPAASAWTDGALDTGIAEEAAERCARGQLTWHAMRGSVPVWYHIVTSPQERAAALALSGGAPSSAIRVDADVTVAFQGSLFDELGPHGGNEQAGPDDWYPEPGIEPRYSRRSATDLCELLALTELGHARLEFMTRGADGTFVPLRSLRAGIREADAEAWSSGALHALRTLVPNVDDLADAIVSEGPTGRPDPEAGDEERWDETDEQEQPSDRTSTTNGPDSPETPARPEPAPPKPARLPADVLAKVKAMLRQAEDPAATQAEAEAFLQKATALMAKYGIEQAMLRGDDPATREKPADRVVDVVAPWARECKRLLSAIAFAMRCQPIYPGGKANKGRVHLFGFTSDLHSVDVLYTSLRLQMLQGADRAGTRHRPPGELPRAYKRSWMLGFIRAVALRIGEAERAAREESERDRAEAAATESAVRGRSVALVLADRTTEVKAEVASHYPKVGKTRRTRFTGSGYRQGHVDGQQADIGGLALDDEGEELGALIA